MVELTDSQQDLLSQKIVAAICDVQLQMELIDHCCCAVEELMSEGYMFDDALDQALLRLEPEGIHNIEVAVQHILIPQTIKTMKAILFFTGFVAAFCILLGIMFRWFHWPGAAVIQITGHLSLIASMITLIFFTFSAPHAVSKASWIRTFFGALGGILIGAGATFKLLHWPGASIMLLLGMALILLIFLPIFFWQVYRSSTWTL